MSPKQGHLLRTNLLSYFKKSVLDGVPPFRQLLTTRESRERMSPCLADVIPDCSKGMRGVRQPMWPGWESLHCCIRPLEITTMLRNPQSDLGQAWSPGVPGLGLLTVARGAGARPLSPLLLTTPTGQDRHGGHVGAGIGQLPGWPLGVCDAEMWLGTEASRGL